MSNLIIAFDFDGPLAWSGGYELFFKFVESLGIRVYWDIWHKTHHVDEAMKLPREEINRLSQLFHYSPHGENMLWIPKAHEVMKKYQSQFDYVLITARQDYAEVLARKFLLYQFPDISFKDLYFDHAYRKGEAILKSGAVLIVEDNVTEALRIVEQAPDAKVILLPTFLPEPHPITNDRIIMTQAYREAHLATDEQAKIAALNAAWYEVDLYLNSMLQKT